MAKFETVPIGELKHRLPAKLLPLVEEYKEKLEKLSTDQGGKLVLEKGDDAKELRRALKAAASSLNRRIRFPFPWGGRVAQFLSRGQAGETRRAAEGRGRGPRRGGATPEAGKAEESE